MRPHQLYQVGGQSRVDCGLGNGERAVTLLKRDIMELRFLNISQIASMFNLSRATVRARLRKAAIHPAKQSAVAPLYDMAQVGPALFFSPQ